MSLTFLNLNGSKLLTSTPCSINSFSVKINLPGPLLPILLISSIYLNVESRFACLPTVVINVYLGSVIFPANISCQGSKTLSFNIPGFILIASTSSLITSLPVGLPTNCSLVVTFLPSTTTSSISSNDLALTNLL